MTGSPVVSLSGAGAPDSDEWWVKRLTQGIRDRNRGRGWSRGKVSNPAGTRPGIEMLDAWLRGEPPLPVHADSDYVAAWGDFLRMSRTNYADLLVSSRTERIVPLGWRTAAAEGGDTDGDEAAEAVAVEVGLRERVSEAVHDMCGVGHGYLLCGADEDSGRPVVTRESPLATIVASDVKGRPRAGLRIVEDEWTGDVEVWLYRRTSEGIYQRVARRPKRGGGWAWADEGRVPLPRFPLRELANRDGVGEFERHLDPLQRINDTIFTRLVLTKLQAHRQRAIERPVPQAGDQVDVDVEVDAGDYVSGPDALWLLPPGAKLWESGTADLSAVRLMVEDDVKALCATTKTPIWQMLPGSQNQSATGSERAHEGFLSLIEDRRHRADAALAEVLATCFDILGDDTRSDASRIRTIWAPTERYGLSEKAQALASLYGKVPFDELMVDVWQARPGDLERLRQQRGADLLYGAAASGG